MSYWEHTPYHKEELENPSNIFPHTYCEECKKKGKKKCWNCCECEHSLMAAKQQNPRGCDPHSTNTVRTFPFFINEVTK